ncbi:MAG: ATP-binding protein [Phycisphaerae bacterium]|nr:ATP-binding protein [Phycisphaerae bacterium]
MSIKNKLIAIMMITCIAAILLAGILFIVWGNHTLRSDTIQNLSIQAKIIADKCRNAIVDGDVAGAEKTLDALHVEPSIIYACIRDKNGAVFASYYRDATDNSVHLVELNKNNYGFGNTSINVREDIIYRGRTIGTILLRSDLNPLKVMLKRNALIIAAVLLFASFIAYFLSMRLQQIISQPILSLVRTTKVISENKDYSTRVPKGSNDELGLLINAFNDMLEKIYSRDSELVNSKNELEIKVGSRTLDLTVVNKKLRNEIAERKQAEKKLKAMQAELMETSRQAGMAEVATDVLHNVGNVLNSVNVSTSLIAEKISGLKIPHLKQVVDMIESHLDNLQEFLTYDQKGKHIPSYLIKVVNLLTEDQADINDKLESLVKNIGHIKQIINMQQLYSRKSGIETPTLLSEVVENAISINNTGFEQQGVQLRCEFAEFPEINIDRQKVLQILVNLVSNAKYSLIHSENKEKFLTIRFYQYNDDRLRIEVSDNGMGIEEENLIKIFRHGFTTKKTGNGFGLHSGALAAKEMAGALFVHSDGAGKGATFTLELPFKPAAAMAVT